MSWDSYIDNMIGQSKDPAGASHIDKGSIIGLDGGAPWTTTTHAQSIVFKPTEAEQIAKVFKSGDFTSFATGGIKVEGVKYQFLRAVENKIVYAKKKDCGALTLQMSKTAIVIGHTPEGCQQGQTNKGVSLIAEYLESLNM